MCYLKPNSLKKPILIIFIVLLIDQLSKIYIKTHFYLGEEIRVLGLDWFRIHFVENNGMAWGTEFGGRTGKLFLTIFRLFAIVGIGYWLYDSVQKKANHLLIIAIALIFAGALGNIIDSVFYGIIFDTPGGRNVATFFADKPYGELFHGKVVDMFYFPMYRGEKFTFFNAIFNVADTAISVAVGLLLFFNKQAFSKPKEEITTPQ